MLKRSIQSILLMLVLSGCMVRDQGYIVAEELLDKTAMYCLHRTEGDERRLYELSKQTIIFKGIKLCEEDNLEQKNNSKYKILYSGQWKWDITWYLLDYNLSIYDNKSNLLVATGGSLNSSFVRKTPTAVVDRVVDMIFKTDNLKNLVEDKK